MNAALYRRYFFCQYRLPLLSLPEGRRHEPSVDGQEMRILRCPLCSQSVERALRVVFLIGDHPPNSDDQVIKSLGGGPKVTDTYHRIVEIGMEDWREHPALWRTSWIAKRQVHLKDMGIPFKNLA